MSAVSEPILAIETVILEIGSVNHVQIWMIGLYACIQHSHIHVDPLVNAVYVCHGEIGDVHPGNTSGNGLVSQTRRSILLNREHSTIAL